MLELTPAEAEDRALPDLVQDERVVQFVRETAVTGRPPAIGENNILTITRHAQSRHLMYSVTPVQARNEGMLGVVLLLRDVTRFQEVDRIKSQFIMTASHELRTPLTSIAMGVDLLLERAVDRLDAKDKQLLVAAHDELQRLQALVEDLLDLSRIEAGTIRLDFARVPVAALFARVTAIFGAQADQQSVTLSAGVAPDLPDAHADPGKITWVLTNLVSNALRYVHRGGHIELAARRVGEQLFISVRDDGVGIAPEHQERIFEKFVQLPEAGRGLIPGWGGTQRLPRMIPQAKASEIIFLGVPMAAEEAYRLGLVNKVVPQAHLLPTAKEWASKICEKGPLAIRRAKEAMIRGTSMSLEDGLRLELAFFEEMLHSEEYREGLRALAEGRRPKYRAHKP